MEQGDDGTRRPEHDLPEGINAEEAADAIEQLSDEQLESSEEPGEDQLADEAVDELSDDDEPDEYDDEVEEDGDGEDSEEEPLYKVTVDGEEMEVPLSELVNGYSRTSDYTRKTQELAKERRATASERQATQQVREQYAEILEIVNSAVGQQLGADQWQALQRDYRAAKQATQAEQVQAFQEQVKEEAELLTHAIPEWEDTEVAESEKAAMRAYAQDLGYTEDQLRQVADHRLMVVLRDAWRYKELTTKGREALEEKKDRNSRPTLKPGARTTQRRGSKKRKAAQGALKKLRQTGMKRDAAEALMATGLLDGEFSD